ncbi:MAG TPA: VCBS repeat-containing protein, partial [Saprospiraceae bacterium]|nr:VCBS repeat-containing protein [Saprospiraceae bacterium]
MFVTDVDKDGTNDLLTVGRYVANSSQLSIWHLQGSDLSLVQRLPLTQANVTSANSVYASDLDNDGIVEIMIGGYSNSLSNSKGHASVWLCKEQKFSLEASATWQLAGGTAKTIAGGNQGNTAVNNVKAGDLDGDGKKEMVTAGFAYDGAKVTAQIKIWRWDGNDLMELASQEWATDYLTEAKSIALNDVNGDGKIEIVQSGIAAAEASFKNPEGVHDRGQLRVWTYNGTGLSLIESKDWTFDEGSCAWNIGNGDVDNDGVVEMITVGCTALRTMCDPDM